MSHDCSRVKTHGGFVASRIATVSSPVARQAHNLKVVSSNLAPATNFPLFLPFKQRVFSFFGPLSLGAPFRAIWGNLGQGYPLIDTFFLLRFSPTVFHAKKVAAYKGEGGV